MKYLIGSFRLPRAQSGLSLIELMIALALGLVLTLGVVQVFLGSSQTYRVTDSLGKVQENIRFTLGTLQREARMAGHFGCLINEPFNQLDQTNAAYDPIVYDNRAVRGWEAGSTGLGDDFTITTLTAGGTDWSNGSGDSVPTAIQGDIVPGTDFIVISGGERVDVNITGVTGGGNGNAITTSGPSNVDAGAIITVVEGDCSGADLFQKTNIASANSISKGAGGTPGNVAGGKFDNLYDSDADVYTFTSTAYFIGEGANGGPALFRERLDPGNGAGAVELAEGVENMQILYGLDTDPTPGANSYVIAANVTNWDQVVSVRMALLFRTGDTITDVAEARNFNLVGTEITTQSDRRSRVVGLSTVGIRNRLE